jgi:hypothetical protein
VTDTVNVGARLVVTVADLVALAVTDDVIVVSPAVGSRDLVNVFVLAV